MVVPNATPIPREPDPQRPRAVRARPVAVPLKDPAAFPLNRELSLLAFNRRVLELAEDPQVPLLDRLRFLCILGSNLD